jgi:hypothetical protein
MPLTRGSIRAPSNRGPVLVQRSAPQADPQVVPARIVRGWPGRIRAGPLYRQKLVDAHHGDVRVASDGDGRGTRFTVRLPRQTELSAGRTVSRATP